MLVSKLVFHLFKHFFFVDNSKFEYSNCSKMADQKGKNRAWPIFFQVGNDIVFNALDGSRLFFEKRVKFLTPFEVRRHYPFSPVLVKSSLIDLFQNF